MRMRQVISLEVEYGSMQVNHPRVWGWEYIVNQGLGRKDIKVKTLAADEPEQVTRSYVVGLPVVVTVNADGEVTCSVDTSEAGEAIANEGASIEDVRAVNGAHDDNTIRPV